MTDGTESAHVGITSYVTPMSSTGNLLFAASTLAIVPVIVLFA